MSNPQKEAIIELAKRKLEQEHTPQRESLYEFLKYYWLKERKQALDENRHIKLICEKLEKVYSWEIKRLIINIPPRSLKTETVSIAFPAWVLWHDPRTKFMEISYSAGLSETNSLWCRNMYLSDTYLSVFPRRIPLNESQNTKQHRETIEWWQYYAAWSTGTIIGKWCDIMIIDDPISPDEAKSDVIRSWVNNNYQATLKSRLNNPQEWAIVIIMQRLHDNDLVGFLLDLESSGQWEKREKLIIPAITEKDDEYVKQWESFFETRFPKKLLEAKKKENPVIFSTQYQQEPVDKDSQEFHEERFRYYTDDTQPKNWRIFTVCDPAFSKRDSADNTSIVTGLFDWMDLYILEYTFGKYNPGELIDKLIYHKNKRNPEKIGIESIAAQTIIGFNLRAELERRWQYVDIHEIRQILDKEQKIRKLIPLYRNWHIYHKPWMDDLELELKRFPRGKHDDIIDSVQMLYSLYEIVPNSRAYKDSISIEYDANGRPMMVWIDEEY
jgi:predicted phage terminase large subunit-like protein